MSPEQAKTHSWNQEGSVSIWRYLDNSRNYPGWHFVLDELGRVNLGKLLTALIEDSQSLHRTISITRPTKLALKIPNNKNGAARTRVPSKVWLEYDPEEPQSWFLKSREDTLVWKMGRNHVDELASALNDPQDYFDRSFGGEPEVWFWGVLKGC